MTGLHPDDHVYYQAARDADSLVAEHSIEGWISNENIDQHAFLYLANQRALRVVMTLFMGVNPKELNLSLNSPKFEVDVPDNLRPLLPILAAAWMDGWACRHHLEYPEEGQTGETS